MGPSTRRATDTFNRMRKNVRSRFLKSDPKQILSQNGCSLLNMLPYDVRVLIYSHFFTDTLYLYLSGDSVHCGHSPQKAEVPSSDGNQISPSQPQVNHLVSLLLTCKAM